MENRLNVLLIEDDEQNARFVRDGLQARGHTAEVVGDGRRGLIRASSDAFDVLVIDRMLPLFDGLAVVKALRASSIGRPVIFLTAIGGVADRIEGLRGGADDYLVKPFDLDELNARVEVLGRRPPLPPVTVVLRHGQLAVDRLARQVSVDGRPVALTTSEFAMLEMLLLNAGRSVTKAMILESVFDLQSDAPGAVVEPHMSRLRAKLARTGLDDPIRTLRGVGYTVNAH